jgi:hypothetical protein
VPLGTKIEVLLKDGAEQLKKLYPKVVHVPK